MRSLRFKKMQGVFKQQQKEANATESIKLKTCDWCGGVIEPEGHDCYDPQSEKQYLYRNKKRLAKKR